MEQEKFEIYAILELMGRQQIAGKCVEQVVAGTGFLRITVPETKSNPSFDRFIHPNALYAINPVTKEVAEKKAEMLQVQPIESWDIRKFMEKANAKGLMQPEMSFTEEKEENYD